MAIVLTYLPYVTYYCAHILCWWSGTFNFDPRMEPN